MTNADDITRYFEFAKSVTLEAGKIVNSAFEKEKNIQVKDGHIDFVTLYDKKVEENLITVLSKEFPGHKFIAEESFEVIPELTDAPTWIIDPIDGTTNFIHAYPEHCLSVALAIDKQLEIGIVYNPSNQELYTARRGQGAFLNGRRIHVSEVTELKNALLMFEPAGIGKRYHLREFVLARMEALLNATQGMRNNGSAALALAYLARGIIDVYQVEILKPWDVAAGALLVREAGGIIVTTQGKEYDFMNPRTLAASTELLAKSASKLIAETDRQTDNDFKKLSKI